MAYICPVCGFEGLLEPPYFGNTDAGSYEICPCCKFQFGYTGAALGKEFHETYRKKWIIEGAKWFEDSKMPKDWSLEEQLEKIGIKLGRET